MPALHLSGHRRPGTPPDAPGTGTPEAGGITSREVLEILRGLRGLDVVARATWWRSRPRTTTPSHRHRRRARGSTS
ncbi:arginase family protein [Kocuria rhizophila]|nr:arginase family protein [Kocuria rhizophila]